MQRYRIRLPSALFVLLLASGGSGVSAEALPGSSQHESVVSGFTEQVDNFLGHLVSIRHADLARVFGEYEEIVGRHIDLNTLHVVPYEVVEALLNEAARESLDALTLFTLEQLQNQDRFSIVFDEPLLQRVDRYFDFHGLFSIALPSVDDGATVRMKFLVIGQGKFIVGYTRNARIKHPDYGFATGHYDYRELFVMDARRDEQGKYGFFDIKGFSAPGAVPGCLKGPLDVDILSMRLVPGSPGNPVIRVQYDLWGVKEKIIQSIPIETRKDRS